MMNILKRENRINNKVSVYVKGNDETPDYYRIYQYFNLVWDILYCYHQMLPDWMYRRFMPISKKHILIKGFTFLTIYIRMVLALTYDLFRRPAYIVVLRRITPRWMPFPIKPLLEWNIKRGSKLLWDFDDDILAFKEMSLENFNWFSKLATHISVTHEGLKQLIEPAYWEKVTLLPTTDGDSILNYPTRVFPVVREESMEYETRLVWVGTSVNLPYLEDVMDTLEEAAVQLKEKTGKSLWLNVVCDKPLSYTPKNFTILNCRWFRDLAIDMLAISHIGIMPLTDSKIARGKGGFKLVQYLSVGLPAIGTDVGFNNQVIDDTCGRLIPCHDKKKWIDAILELSDPEKWQEYSENALEKWEKDFPFTKNLDYWRDILDI